MVPLLKRYLLEGGVKAPPVTAVAPAQTNHYSIVRIYLVNISLDYQAALADGIIEHQQNKYRIMAEKEIII
jgi:hypothetical protein